LFAEKSGKLLTTGVKSSFYNFRDCVYNSFDIEL